MLSNVFFLFFLCFAPLAKVALGTSATGGALNLNGVTDELLTSLTLELSAKYSERHPDVKVSMSYAANLDEIGTVANGQNEFAIVSAEASNAHYVQAPDLQVLPFAVLPVVFSYNMPEADDSLVLSLPVLASIWSGSIKFWNDSRIQQLNSKFTLPNERIVPMVLSGNSSINTQLFTTIMSDYDSDWKTRFGIFDSGYRFAASTAGLVQCANAPDMVARITATRYSIGYMSLSRAISNSLTYSAIINSKGEATAPIESFISNGLTANFLTPRMELMVHNIPGKFAYPALGVGYAVVRLQSMTDCTDASAVAEFISWILTSTDAEKLMLVHGFIHTPSTIRGPTVTKLLSMTCKGKSVFSQTIVPIGGPSQVDLLMERWAPDYMDYQALIKQELKLIFVNAESNTVVPQLQSKSIVLGITSNDLSASELASGLVQIPMLITAVALIFNLPEKRPELSLILSRDVVLRIFNGKIVQWNDPAIRKLNPFIHMPPEPITFVAINGSTSVYMVLKKALASFDMNSTEGSRTNFDLTPNSVWPEALRSRIVFVQSHEAVISYIEANPYTIGAVAHLLAEEAKAQTVVLVNAAGEEVLPTSQTIADTATDAVFSAQFSSDLLDRARTKSYPIVSFTNYIFYRNAQSVDCQRNLRALQFIQWSVENNSALSAAMDDGYVPAFRTPHPRVTQILRDLRCNGQLLWPYPPEETLNLIPIIIPVVLGTLAIAALLTFGFWRFHKRMQYLTAKLNDAKIAVELSNAIATLDLEKMAFLEQIERPTTTQACCLRIFHTLRHVKKYIPGTVIYQLQKEVNGETDEDEEEAESLSGASENENDEEHGKGGKRGKKLVDGSKASDQVSTSERSDGDSKSKTTGKTYSDTDSQGTSGGLNRMGSAKYSVHSGWSSNTKGNESSQDKGSTAGGGGGSSTARTNSFRQTTSTTVRTGGQPSQRGKHHRQSNHPGVPMKQSNGARRPSRFAKGGAHIRSGSASQTSSQPLLSTEDSVIGHIKIVRREMTVLFLGIANFEELLHLDSHTTIHMFNRFFDTVYKIVHTTSGVITSIDGRFMFMHWNAAKKCTMARLQACEVAGKIIQAAKETQFRVRIGIAAGHSVYTSLGCEGMSSFLVLGYVKNRARILQQLNGQYGTSVLVDEEVRKQGPQGALFFIDLIDVPTDDQYGIKKLRVYELVSDAIQSATDMDGEWLYAFQSTTEQEGSTLAERQQSWAKCADAFYKGQYAQAHDYVSAYILKYGINASPYFIEDMKRLLDAEVAKLHGNATVTPLITTSGGGAHSHHLGVKHEDVDMNSARKLEADSVVNTYIHVVTPGPGVRMEAQQPTQSTQQQAGHHSHHHHSHRGAAAATVHSVGSEDNITSNTSNSSPVLRSGTSMGSVHSVDMSDM